MTQTSCELSDADFVLDGVSHTIRGMYTDEQLGYLAIFLKPAVSGEGLSFTIDGVAFAISDAAIHGPIGVPGTEAIFWDADPFRWTRGQRIPVSLTRLESEPEPELEPEAPSAPTDVMVEAGDMMLTVTWDEPDDSGTSLVTGYRVQYRPAGGTWTVYHRNGLVRETTIEGLVNGVEYHVRVAAINDAGTGPYSASEAGTPMATEEVPTAALPFFGALALAAGLVAAGRRRLRARRFLTK